MSKRRKTAAGGRRSAWEPVFVLSLDGEAGRLARIQLIYGEVLLLLEAMMRFPNPNVGAWAYRVLLRDMAPPGAVTSPPLPLKR